MNRRRAWLLAGLIALILFLGGVASNLVAADLETLLAPYRLWVWIGFFVALIVAIVAAVWERRQPDAAAPPDLRSAATRYETLRRGYLHCVVQRTEFLPLRAVDFKSASAETGEKERLHLADVYVDLNTTTTAPDRDPRNRGKDAGNDLLLPDRERKVSALAALASTQRMVLLGDPGSGKSTFLNHLAVCLASAVLQPQHNWLARLADWPSQAAPLLPAPLALRQLAAWYQANQPHQRKAGLLLAYLEHWLAELGQPDFLPLLTELLHSGDAILLLDGLDEVPLLDDTLSRIKEMIADLPAAFPAARILVTCRVLSYQDRRWQLPRTDWPSFELDKLDEEKIDRFIRAWYDQLAELQVVKDAAKPSERLSQAVRRRDLWRLVRNPLLLTVMALVHTNKGELPDARALLYEDVVDLLLWRWEAIKLEDARGDETTWRQLLREAELNDIDIKKVIWELAYRAHSQVRSEREPAAESEATADIAEADLLDALSRQHPQQSLDWARSLVQIMQQRAGLLVESRPRVYTFPHRTFQEYLAGRSLSVQGGFSARAQELADQGVYWWEVILLAVGWLVHSGQDEAPLVLVNELCPESPAGADEIALRRAWLAGRVLSEIGLPRAQRHDLGKRLAERVPQRLIQVMTSPLLAPRERADAGSVLSALGDLRDLDEMIRIPAGPFLMGDDDDTDARPQHTLHVADFRIGKYPVTNGQYAAFVAAAGHRPPDHWRGATPPPELRNHPVTYVSWSDAVAYCAWLSRERGELVRLPTEVEWEKAARGSDGRIYPWGDAEPTPNLANYDKSGIDGTSPVGCFPAGASPYGCLDMAGNVFEWTSSLWGKDWRKPDYGYPYDPTDGREDLSAPDSVLRVMRGGSWGWDMRWVRCAARYRYLNLWRYVWGFRVVSPGF